ncbi:hypothetical protein POL68_05885 [Stigmatella sp. ncwal1]|uniref:HD domain-containing protein n=1 Tax=Stigmatella ashevillensis TaxID=2995309 RepID=A0ABT5D2V5_9BACT|nr:hypothetical protein [Stigmatella ashevillena]MDC0707995.1 hypothetical protein [Stigmatella ashevillena]
MMSPSSMSTRVAPAGLTRLRPLLSELLDLKRVRTPDQPDGLAAHGFRRAWAALSAGVEPIRVALRETALALASVRLGGMDAAVLQRAGLSPEAATKVLRRSLEAAAVSVDPRLRERLHAALAEPFETKDTALPVFVEKLVCQPRAGATSPQGPRILMEPLESHADHCYAVAISAVLIAPLMEADPVLPFVAGLSHHLYSADLPDAGFAGESLLAEELAPIVKRLTERALGCLDAAPAARVKASHGLLAHADTPEAQAFHAADVLDRVLEMEYHARVAGFSLGQALDDLELVHEGPLQPYEKAVVKAAGVWP